jgi:predicted TIM-barrel fold metal-dependent hydrolase
LTAQENDFAATTAAAAQDRISVFASVNPKRAYAVQEFDRCVTTHRCQGLKLHFWASDVRMNDPEHVGPLRILLSSAAERRCPVVVHLFNNKASISHAEQVTSFLRDVVQPAGGLRVSIAHLGGPGGYADETPAGFDAVIRTVAASDDLKSRVWVDCSAVLFSQGSLGIEPTTAAQAEAIGRQLKQFGLDRVLWGSDNVPDALNQLRSKWPLSVQDWSIIAGNDGRSFGAT